MAQGKLLIYEALVKHYNHTDRPTLLPRHMSDLHTAITDLLGEIWKNETLHNMMILIFQYSGL